MGLEWKGKGCEVCRGLWESGKRPPELVVNYELHARLHRCEVCGTYWEQHERFADTIEEHEAKKLYPAAFTHGEINE